MTDAPGNSLTNTLVLALSQCQEQSRVLHDHTRRINDLLEENEHLRKEIRASKNTRNAEPPREESFQVQDLFQKHVEAQAEIQRLKKKLRSYKERVSKRSSIPLSSPMSTPATPATSSPKHSAAKRAHSDFVESSPAAGRIHGASELGYFHTVDVGSSGAISSSPPRKKIRTIDGAARDVLAEIPSNTSHSALALATASRRGISEKAIGGISFLAEDGDEQLLVLNQADPGQRTISRNDSVYHRLDGLLAGSTPARTPLTRPRSRSPQQMTSAPEPSLRKNFNISNIQHTVSEIPLTSEDQAARSAVAGSISGGRSLETSAASNATLTKEHDITTSSPERHIKSIKHAKKPLRTQPANNLMLSSFKPNPRWLSSHNISYDDFLNDRQHERMRTLATTLPHLPGETIGNHSTDHELLLEFLGPGSEEKIASLTPVARQNLLVEAKTRRVAQHFKLAKQNIRTDREDGPPGFWSTDMPGTQEAEENKQAGRQRDREEVRRRYDDAMEGNGKWVFVDE